MIIYVIVFNIKGKKGKEKEKASGKEKEAGKQTEESDADPNAQHVGSPINVTDDHSQESEPPSPTISQIMLSKAAMLNLYYIAHDAPHVLALRNFDWPDNPKKKKKGKKK